MRRLLKQRSLTGEAIDNEGKLIKEDVPFE